MNNLSLALATAAVITVSTTGCTTSTQKEIPTAKETPKSEEVLRPVAERPVARKSAPKPKPYRAPIESYVLEPYTRSGWPTTFAKYEPRMGEIEAYRRKAAELAASNRQCKKVTASNVSSYKGSLNNLHFWVDCNDGMKRFNFTEGELDANKAAISQGDKAFSKVQAGKLCEKLITKSVNYPSTLGINNWDYGFSKYDPLGNVQVSMNFKAKNAFNLELKFIAICTFQPGNPNGEILIKERTNQ